MRWLPYDEDRLYRLLRVDRGYVFRYIRDDRRHSLAQLGRKRGIKAKQFAQRLVAPRREKVSSRTYKILRRHALDTLTQGHLGQHILFHALHQTAVRDRSTRIFGTPSKKKYLHLRRAEVSPLQIGEIYGRGCGELRKEIVNALKAAAKRGVSNGFLSRKQAKQLTGSPT